MKYSNALIYGSDYRFHKGGFCVENGCFQNVGPENDGIDLKGKKVIPGLIDVHNHGNSGVDFSTASVEDLRKMARYLGKNGITSFVPASATLHEEGLAAAYRCAAALKGNQADDESGLRGIHMEGPFFSYNKRGAQNPDYLRLPDTEMFERLQEAADGLIRIADVAPELEGGLDFIRRVSQKCTVSIAHTEANYEQTLAAIDAGATHVTHLFNGMPSLLHRNPGVIGAAAERENVRAELICDGKHVHPSAVRAAFKLFGAERICMVSDALAACGMEEGDYSLAGEKIIVRDGLAYLTNGTISGAATNVWQGLKNLVAFGIPLEDAVRCGTANPAQAAGIYGEVGSIENGKSADFVVLKEDLAPESVCIRGKILI